MTKRKRRLLLLTLLALFLLPLAADTHAQRRGRRRAAAPRPAATPAASPTPAESSVKRSANDPSAEQIDTYEAVRGQRVTVTGKNFDKAEKIEVRLERLESTTGAQVITPQPPTVNDDGTKFTFIIPRDVPLGSYAVSVHFPRKGKTALSDTIPISETKEPFRVTTSAAPEISAVYPKVTYPSEKEVAAGGPKSKSFDFTVAGSGFSPSAGDNALIIEGHGPLAICPEKKAADRPVEADCANVTATSDGRVLKFSGIPLLNLKTNKGYAGPLKIRVRVGDKQSEPRDVVLSSVGRWAPALIAGGVVAVVLAIIAFLLAAKDGGRIGRNRHSLLKAVFLDRETNTYSLSKAQFYAWTLAALFGYVYLTAARSLVQGVLDFPDPPENLPGILAVSVGTGALAVGISGAKGSKGSGEENPSLADFITTGGVVAAERIQFLVWTVVGVLSFLFLTVLRDPGDLLSLPAVPDRFMYLMGISSAGYLGGKLARSPGPVISQMSAGFSQLTLIIRGNNLSRDATFSINDVDILPENLDPAEHPAGRPVVLTKGDTPGFAKGLKLVLKDITGEAALAAWLKSKGGAEAEVEDEGGANEYRLTITNPDGQRSEWAFTPVATEVRSPNAVPAQPAVPN